MERQKCTEEGMRAKGNEGEDGPQRKDSEG
jgi:hypothetical protein